MIKIILADDHNIVRDGIRTLLEREPLFQVAGEAINGAEALSLIEKGTAVDIILADMNMPVMTGVELLQQVKERFPATKVIILSALDNEKYLSKAYQAGANGYLLKSVTSDEMNFAIKHVMQNNQYFCTELTSRIFNKLLTLPDPKAAEYINDIEFSEREIEILNLLSEGYTNQEIGEKLFTSKRTVEGIRQSMIAKTGVRNTLALVRYAMANSLVSY
jgi:DNA-binding NarL/FixJ family response regulator